MNNASICYLLISFLLIGCTTLKNIQNKDGTITYGDDNVIINLPIESQSYSHSEVKNNIEVLKKIIQNINIDLGYVQPKLNVRGKPSGNQKKREVKPDSQEFIKLDAKKRKAEEALRLWENLLKDN